MAELGSATLVASLLVAIYSGVAALIATRGDRRWAVSARRGIYAVFGLLLITVITLEASFMRTDLTVALVAEHSSESTPTLYKLTALWGSQAGSLLLWAFVLSIASSAVLYITRNKHREVVPWATAVLAGIATFFIGLMIAGIFFPDADSWPFAASDPVPAVGAGLTPLLQHPAMAMHPPMLYSGYVFFTIPFAFAIGALITRRLDASWIRSTRRFALIAWVLLTIGIALGARWSYSELGWGGYWAWDPVENAALIPWMTGTAFLHSIMVQERRGMLRVWNVSLICATFVLSLLGTFLVRSGVLQSIHAFGASKVGVPLLVLIGVITIGSTILIASRRESLQSERTLDSLMSREAIFLINNILLVSLAAIVLFGTFFPLISDLVGDKASIGPPWFDKFATPLAIGLVFFMGIGPLVAWRRVSLAGIRRALAIPILITLAGAAILALTIGVSESPTAYVFFLGGIFTIAAIGQEVVRGVEARQALGGGGIMASFNQLITRNRRRYGGYVVHVGLVVALFGIAASSSFQSSNDLRLEVGESAEVDGYTVTYDRPYAQAPGALVKGLDSEGIELIDDGSDKIAFGAVLTVTRDGEDVSTLKPSREYFSPSNPDPMKPIQSFFQGEPTSEVGRDEGPTRDLWSSMQPDLTSFDGEIQGFDRRYADVVRNLDADTASSSDVQNQLASLQGEEIRNLVERYMTQGETPPAEIRFNVNPFVIWFWVGVFIGVSGALFGLWPSGDGRRRRVSDVYGARLARDLSKV